MPDSGRRYALVLDTGPLLTYLVLHYLDETGATKARRDEVFRDVRGKDEDVRKIVEI